MFSGLPPTHAVPGGTAYPKSCDFSVGYDKI